MTVINVVAAGNQTNLSDSMSPADQLKAVNFENNSFFFFLSG